MEYREKAGQSLTEPITVANFRSYAGLGTDETHDTLIGTMITAARLWLESETGCSVISKSYEVEFERADGDQEYDGYFNVNTLTWGGSWYELPFYPVVSITSVEIGGTSVDYEEKGLDRVSIYPESSVSTGTTNNTLDVEFIAGSSTDFVKTILYRMVNDLYDTRKDGMEVNASRFKWSTMTLINQLSNNTSI